MIWHPVLHSEPVPLRLDCFQIEYESSQLMGLLDEKIFEENIADLYVLFRGILGENSRPFDFYEREFGQKLEDYQFDWTTIKVPGRDGLRLTIHLNYALLFIEGKVMVEEFSVEPILLNWLFRNSEIENKLAGCIISDITG